jgi:hypothetical protein
MQAVEHPKKRTIKKDRTEIQKRLDEFKKGFDLLADELRDLDPGAFDHLRDNFFSFMRDSRFKELCCDKWLQEGKSPVREWLKVNGYPTGNEVKVLRFVLSLTNESQKAFEIVLDRYFLMYNNSVAFRKKCDDQNNAGINSFVVWMEKQGFEPVFKQENTEGAYSD